MIVLLLEFGMLRSQDVWEQLRLYGLGSALIAVLAFAAAVTGHASDLYALGAVTIALKALAVPLGVGAMLRNLEVPDPSARRWCGCPPRSSRGIVLSGFCVPRPLTAAHRRPEAALPLSALAVAVAVVLVAFLLMIVRPYASSQLLGFLALENGVSLASLVIAPDLPLILALLLLFDVLIGVLVFVVLVQYLALQRSRSPPTSWIGCGADGVAPRGHVGGTDGGDDRLARLAGPGGAGRHDRRGRRLARRDRGRRPQRPRRQRAATAGHWLRLDSLGAVFLLATGFLYAAAAVFSVGYLHAGARRRVSTGSRAGTSRTSTCSAGRSCSYRSRPISARSGSPSS